MVSKFNIGGMITALFTPLTPKEQLKEDAFKRLIDFQIENGINGFFALGTAGEGIKLSTEKRKKGAETVVKYTRGRIPIILHVGNPDTERTVELAKHGEGLGVDALSAVGPFYYKPDLKGLIQHYKRFAEAVNIPVFVYNIPGRQGYNISPEFFGKIVEEVPQIVGLKDTSYDVGQLQDYVHKFGEKYTVLGAGDSLIFSALAVGTDGHISQISNAFPEMAIQIYRLIKEGKYEEAREIQFRLNDVLEVLKKGPEISSVKEVLKMRGIDVGVSSSPLRQPSKEESIAIREGLETIGVL